MAANLDLEVFSKRLRSARKMQRLSMDGLLERMKGVKLSKPAISKYENGKMLPSDNILEALADALGVDVSYFMRPFVCTSDNFQINFRKKSSMSNPEVESLKEKVRDKVERYLEIEGILADAKATCVKEFLPKKENIRTKEEAEDFADELRKLWGLGDFPIVNVQRELERHGIKVLTLDNVSDDFDGLSGTIDDDKIFVVINSNPNKTHVERRRFTAMHEIGHQLMKFAPEVTSREQEVLCHTFANEMLITRSAFKDQMKGANKVSLLSLRPLQVYYGISIDALMKKAETTGLINNSAYTSYNIYKRANREFCEATSRSLYQEAPLYDRFASLVLQAYSMQLIEKSKAQELLYDVPENIKADITAL